LVGLAGWANSVDAGNSLSANAFAEDQVTPAAEVAPDTLLKAATFVVLAKLKQHRNLETSNPKEFSELVESTLLPLFDFRHMTQLAMARNWRLATPEQQDALVAGFSTLLVHTYSTVLTSYQDQVIDYKPLRIVPGESEVTVKSVIRQHDVERMTIDYDMDRTTAGWKIYDIKISGISLISAYRPPFARIIRDNGVAGLIESLSSRNRETESAPNGHEGGNQYFLMMYSVIQSFFRGDR
jgi:phospholipid transport system substrate-binding protein